MFQKDILSVQGSQGPVKGTEEAKGTLKRGPA